MIGGHGSGSSGSHGGPLGGCSSTTNDGAGGHARLSLIVWDGHNNNPVAAFMFGLLLGVSFLRGGWESCVTAHFLGNYLLFMGTYL